MSSGIAQRKRNINQGIKKAPPPLAARMRGNRQMLPVPTAMPSAAKAEPTRALKLTDGALKLVKAEEKMNIAYHGLVRRRAQILLDQGKADVAKKEVSALHNDLKKRGVNQPVLDEIEALGKKL